MESVDSGERNGERERRRRPETIGARALCTTVSEYLWLLPDSSGTPSVRARPADRERYCLFKFRVRFCAPARDPGPAPASLSSSNVVAHVTHPRSHSTSFAVESLEGPDLGLRRLTRADMGAYLVGDGPRGGF